MPVTIFIIEIEWVEVHLASSLCLGNLSWRDGDDDVNRLQAKTLHYGMDCLAYLVAGKGVNCWELAG